MDRPPEFPLRETCNPDNPEECFLWMLVALPAQHGAPLIMPVEYLRMVSQRLWDCGARPTGVPVVKYRPPSGTDPHWMFAPGSWVPVSEPDPPRNDAKEAWNRLSWQQKAELRAIANAEHEENP